VAWFNELLVSGKYQSCVSRGNLDFKKVKPSLANIMAGGGFFFLGV
jgi:hypothetical protein